MDLSVRSSLAEVMDDAGLDAATYRRCLADLAAINRLTFTHAATLRWLARATRGMPEGATFSLLDVAYGQGDLLRAIAVWAQRRGLVAELSGVDMNPRSAIAARDATPAGMLIDYRTSDVFAYAPAAKPDFIVSSQFTHHLDNAAVVKLLRWFEENSVRGWYIADLHRHVLAVYGFRVLAGVMRWHDIVKSDGMISIASGFRRAEWQGLLEQAGVPAKISWVLPFRFGISRVR